ncbi:MAG: ATP-binding protein [Bacteroidota bacterium]
MEIIGRHEEMQALQELVESSASEFLAVSGRRRVGKTFLIRKFFKDHLVFDCSGLHEQNQQQQLENFRDALSESTGSKKDIQVPGTWLQAFSLLKEYINSIKGNKRKVVFLDELPWFETPRSGFKAALDNFWNNYCTIRNDIILVICGSAASWIIKNIINDRGGFHNRVTRQIGLQPFTLAETRAFLKRKRVMLGDYDVLQLYMALGGIPFYLKQVRPGQSVAQIIDFLFFQKLSPFRNEFDNLYASLFKNFSWHVEVVKALSTKDRGMTREEIIAISRLSSGGGFTTILNELSESGFISVHMPYKNVRKETLYRLSDEFSLFYFKFLDGKSKATGWMQKAGQQTFKIWCGNAFENVCLKHIRQIKSALGITGIYTEEASWHYKGNKHEEGSQIDLLIDRADNCINLCEMKFYAAVFEINKAYAGTLQKKLSVFTTQTKTRKNIFLTMVTTYGVANNEYKLGMVSNTVTMDALFAG